MADNPYFVQRFICPGELQPGDLWLWIVRGPKTYAVLGGPYGDKESADKHAGLLNDAYQRGWNDRGKQPLRICEPVEEKPFVLTED